MRLAVRILFFIILVAAAGAEDIQSIIAVDAHGAKDIVRKSDFRGGSPVWKTDVVFSPKPDYPYVERNLRHEGVALFRLDIDVRTGTTTHVTVVQSSGFENLDEAALRCVARWRWRPGTWQQVEVPVVFTISGRLINGW